MTLRSVGITAVLCLALAAIAPAQTNMLTNPGFETGDFTGWTPFGNAYVEAANGTTFFPNSGNHLVSCFGNWTGGFNVTGFFQQFPANPGDAFEIDCFSRHNSGDNLVGGGAPNSNWVVMKMAFFDVGGVEIGAAEGTVLDGNSPTDVWIDNDAVTGIAPAGTVTVQCLILYLQPLFDGGACHIDDVSFRHFPITLGYSQDAITNDVTVSVTNGVPTAIFGCIYSLDPQNGTAPGQGNFGGLWIASPDLAVQTAQALTLTSPFGGWLDGAGNGTFTIAGGLVGSLSGTTVHGVAATYNISTSTVEYSNLASITLN